MLSYEIKRYQTEGATDKQIVLNPNEAQKKEIKSVSRINISVKFFADITLEYHVV